MPNNTFLAPQIGFVPSGNNGIQQTSSIYIGRNGNLTWEAIGFGLYGRPDFMEVMKINLTDLSVPANPRLIGTISIDVGDIQSIITLHPNAATGALNIHMKEVDVCDAGVAKKMIVLASDPYLAT